MRFTKRRVNKQKCKIEHRMWKTIIKIANLRSGGKCEICGGKGEQRDHCFSSTVSILRWEYRNITNLCGACHTKKTHKQSGMDVRVFGYVREREGFSWFEGSMVRAKQMKAYQWTLADLEDAEKELNSALDYYKEKQ